MTECTYCNERFSCKHKRKFEELDIEISRLLFSFNSDDGHFITEVANVYLECLKRPNS